MNRRLIVLIGAVLTTLAIGFSQSETHKGPVFTQDKSLVLPTGFWEWVFIGGPITPNELNSGRAEFPEFHSVYVERENFHYYQEHGNFPEGTILVKELALTQPGKYPDGSLDTTSGRGYFPSGLHGLDVMVKDSKRFGDTHDWGFFTFGHQTPPYEPTAKVMPFAQCAFCTSQVSLRQIWSGYNSILCYKQDRTEHSGGLA